MLQGLAARHEKRHGVRACYVHDAVAVAAVIDPELLTWQRFGVDVECTGEITRGALVVDAFGRMAWPRTVDVALDVRPGAVEELLLTRLEGRR
jgi:inosine-uridine nucleoside N-ribohydrolase